MEEARASPGWCPSRLHFASGDVRHQANYTMIRIRCPRCDHKLQIDDKLAGSRVRCRHCKSVIRVPAAAAPAPLAGSPGSTEEPPREEFSPFAFVSSPPLQEVAEEQAEPAAPETAEPAAASESLPASTLSETALPAAQPRARPAEKREAGAFTCPRCAGSVLASEREAGPVHCACCQF